MGVNSLFFFSLTKKLGMTCLAQRIDPAFDTARLCFAIPSTWEGLLACRSLEASGIRTLATAVFSIEQAARAGEVGCRYIAPCVHELAVHLKRGFGLLSVSPDLV